MVVSITILCIGCFVLGLLAGRSRAQQVDRDGFEMQVDNAVRAADAGWSTVLDRALTERDEQWRSSFGETEPPADPGSVQAWLAARLDHRDRLVLESHHALQEAEADAERNDCEREKAVSAVRAAKQSLAKILEELG